ncbi:hypothetical protein [Streptomyces sp. HNM0574]|uniref:hypothetical protein n=1 Tax=Streptomyces sp. HNM0574 TaxID=2714954 RepID=UPI00146DA3CB|nr:hypothetical protein [Streptomyces sp. HNM0574]NLU69246.1 hypothetical protein [Streptomyces sp. HNM0574]
MTERRPNAAVSTGLGTLLALVAVLLGVGIPGPAVPAPAVPLAGAAIVAAPTADDNDNDRPETHDRPGTGATESVCDAAEAAPPHAFRDTGSERHLAHPGGAALCGGTYVPRLRPWARPLPATPVADGDLLRGARHLGRAPPAPSGN